MVTKTSALYSDQFAVRLIQATWNGETVLLFSNSTGWNWNQSDTTIRWIYVNIFRLTYVKLRLRLENFKGVFACARVIAMTSDRLSFASVAIGQKLFIDSRWLPRWKVCVPGGHITSQNLDGKKICWAGEVAECFDCCCGKLCGFQNLEQSLETTRFAGVWCGILPMKDATLFLPSPKYI